MIITNERTTRINAVPRKTFTRKELEVLIVGIGAGEEEIAVGVGVEEEIAVGVEPEIRAGRELCPLKNTMIATRLATIVSTNAIISNVLRISFLPVVNIGMKLLEFLQLFGKHLSSNYVPVRFS